MSTKILILKSSSPEMLIFLFGRLLAESFQHFKAAAFGNNFNSLV